MEIKIVSWLFEKLKDRKIKDEDFVVDVIYNPNSNDIDNTIDLLEKGLKDIFPNLVFEKFPNENIVELDKIYLATSPDLTTPFLFRMPSVFNPHIEQNYFQYYGSRPFWFSETALLKDSSVEIEVKI